MCDDDKPYVPNKYTARVTAWEQWRKLNMGVDRDPLLVEREKTHGSFKANAEAYWMIKKTFDSYNGLLNIQQRCAMDMIALKLARICSNPKTKDSWEDVAGYAKLGSEACDG